MSHRAKDLSQLRKRERERKQLGKISVFPNKKIIPIVHKINDSCHCGKTELYEKFSILLQHIHKSAQYKTNKKTICSIYFIFT